jgi:hypothetical protein
MPDDGRYLATLCKFGSGDVPDVCARVYDPNDGHLIWEDAPAHEGSERGNNLIVDYSGDWLTVWHGGSERVPPWAAFWNTQTWKSQPAPFMPTYSGAGWSPELDYWAARPNDGQYPVLHARATGKAVVGLGDDYRSSGEQKFSHDGKLFAWGTADGVVHVADIAEVRRRLSAIGLGW